MEKNKQAFADLHMHSIASDGTDSVDALLANVRAAGIRVFSVTDHDTINGAAAMEEIVPDDMTFIRGIEFSCITKAGKCHILGYGCGYGTQAFQDILQKGRAKRRTKLENRLTYLKERFDIEFPKETMETLFEMNSVGKPHLGNLLVSMGRAANKEEAIAKYIDSNPNRKEGDRLDAEETIGAILQSGGIPVWAHPYGGTGKEEVPQDAFERQLKILREAGLRGMECYYSKYAKGRVARLLDVANRSRLLVSGGSDYHGENKAVKLGALGSGGEMVLAEKLTVLGECALKM